MQGEPIQNSAPPARQNVAGTPARQPEVIYREPYNNGEETPGDGGSALHQYAKIVLRHKGIVLLAVILGCVAGFLYTVPQTPMFQAHASLEIQGLNQNFLNLGAAINPNSADSIDPTYDVLTQAKIMESESLRDRAIKKLSAQKAPEGGAPLNRLALWKKALGLNPGASTTREAAIYAAANSFVVKTSGTTRIVEVTCDSPIPQLAADFVNTLVGEFIDQDMEARLMTTEGTSRWLSRQLDDLKIKLEKSEDQLQAYAGSMGLQFTTGDSDGKSTGQRENVADEKFRALQTELLKAQAERVATQSKYELVSSAPDESLPQVLDDANLRDYQLKLTELRRQFAEASVLLTPANSKVRRLQAQIDEVQGAMKKERANVVSRIRNEFDAAKRRELLITSEFDSQSKVVNDQASKAIHYNILKREVDTNRQIYEAMLQKVKEAGIASAMRASGFRVVDPAKVPDVPYKPNATQAAVLGSFGGLVIGVVFVLARERVDRRLRQPGDLAQYLRLPELGVIPSEKASFGQRVYGAATSNPISRSYANGTSPVVVSRKSSLFAESFQATLTSILFSCESGYPPQVIALTSAGPGEGKSTISSNLAVALAEINQRVVLIDGDMRRPRQHELFNLPNTAGLSTLLRDRTPIKGRPVASILQETEVPGLRVITSGPVVSNASNLLHSPRLGELIRALRGEFDTVVIDTPPMLHLSDARVFGQHCDSVILVVRAGKTTRDGALAANRKLQEDGTPVLGTILNDWDPGTDTAGYGYRTYKAYSKYMDK